MELEYKKDFVTVKENWHRFWNGTLGRPILLAISPEAGVTPVAKPAWGAAMSLSCEKVVDQLLRWAETHEFLGEAVPFYSPSLVIDLFPAFLGAEIIISETSDSIDSHAVPFIQDLGSTEIKFRRNSAWWERWVKYVELMKRKCAGRLLFATAQPYYNNLDTLAAIRGNVELLTDLYDNPEGVHFAMKQIMVAHDEILSEICKIQAIDKYGSCTAHGFYSEGRAATPQCDFGFNIGKEHFDEFALPYLCQEIERFDAVEYHLDGSGNINHLESICKIEKVKVIQWVPGAGDNLNKDWTWLFEKINALGKGLWLWADSPEKAVSLWDKYNNSGRMILNVHAENKADMDRYLDAFEVRNK